MPPGAGGAHSPPGLRRQVWLGSLAEAATAAGAAAAPQRNSSADLARPWASREATHQATAVTQQAPGNGTTLIQRGLLGAMRANASAQGLVQNLLLAGDDSDFEQPATNGTLAVDSISADQQQQRHLQPYSWAAAAPTPSGTGRGPFTSLEWLMIVTLVSIILISIVGNLLVCVAIFTDRRLRKLGNAFIVSLAIADLFVSFLVMTFALHNDLMEEWIFGAWFCDVWISCDIMCCTASILNLCAISLDRFVHIKDGLLYNQLMTRRVAISAVIMIWIISALVSFVPINLGWHRPSGGTHLEVHSQASSTRHLRALVQANDTWPDGLGRRTAATLAWQHSEGLAAEPKLNYAPDKVAPMGSSGDGPRAQVAPTQQRQPSAHGRSSRRDDNKAAAQRGVPISGSPGGEFLHETELRRPLKARQDAEGPDKGAAVEGAQSRNAQAGQPNPVGEPARREESGEAFQRASGEQIKHLHRARRRRRSSGPATSQEGQEGHSGEQDEPPEFLVARAKNAPQDPHEGQHNAPEGQTNARDNRRPPPFSPRGSGAATTAATGASGLASGQGRHEPEPPQCMLTLTPTYAVISSTISFYIPCIIMLGLYSKLFACARRHVRNIKAISKAPHPIGAGPVGAQAASGQAGLGRCSSNTTTTTTTTSGSTAGGLAGSLSPVMSSAGRLIGGPGQAANINQRPGGKLSSIAEGQQADLSQISPASAGKLGRLARPGRLLGARTWIKLGRRARPAKAGPQDQPQDGGPAAARGESPAPLVLKSTLTRPTAANNQTAGELEPFLAGAPDPSREAKSVISPASIKLNMIANQPAGADATIACQRQQQQEQEGQNAQAHQKAMRQLKGKQANSGQPPGVQQNARPTSQQNFQPAQHQPTKQQSSQMASHKAAITLGIIMGTFLLCWLPFFCLNIIKAFYADLIPSSLFRASTWLGYANSALNPIIYGIHNSEFRNAFNRIFFKYLTLKNGRQYLNRRFSYDLRSHHNHQAGAGAGSRLRNNGQNRPARPANQNRTTPNNQHQWVEPPKGRELAGLVASQEEDQPPGAQERLDQSAGGKQRAQCETQAQSQAKQCRACGARANAPCKCEQRAECLNLMNCLQERRQTEATIRSSTTMHRTSEELTASNSTGGPQTGPLVGGGGGELGQLGSSPALRAGQHAQPPSSQTVAMS